MAPGSRHGRNDEAKLGYALVHVYEQGHLVEHIRSYGRTLKPGARLEAAQGRVRSVRSKAGSVAPVGLDMRQPWAEELEITPSGGIDEFERKLARNDYPLQALWERGVRRLRVPIQDLTNRRTRRRMRLMADLGHEFQVYCHGRPAQQDRAALRDNGELVTILEVIIGWEEAEGALAEMADLKNDTGLPILLSRRNRKGAAKHDSGARFNHFVRHGFDLAEADELAAFLHAHADAAVDGLMFSVPRDVAPAAAIAQAERIAARLGKGACLYMKSASSSPADVFEDERANAVRVAEAVFTGVGARQVDVILDTFADMGGGYFARAGLVDRRYNPKLGSRVVSTLVGLLSDREWRLNRVEADHKGFTSAVRLTAEPGDALTLVMPRQRLDSELAAGAVSFVELETGGVFSAVSEIHNNDLPFVASNAELAVAARERAETTVEPLEITEPERSQ